MKTTKKVFLSLLAAILMVFFFTIPTLAGSNICTCGQSTWPHFSHHDEGYISNGKSGHQTICQTCKNNGHNLSCALVTKSKNDAHNFEPYGNKIRCKNCYYTEDCNHPDAKWVIRYNTVGGTGTDETTCIKYCELCKRIIETKEHAWEYEELSSSDSNYHYQHKVYCTDCSYVYSGADEGHIWKYLSYKKPAVPKNPVASVESSTSASQDHIAYVQCTKCGHKTTVLQVHSFKKDTCTKCKLKKDSNLKVSKLKKKSVKTSHKKTKYKAHWQWSGGRWIYFKGGIGHNYTTTIKISWKKNSKAYGYFCSIGSPPLKTGSYVTSFDIARTNGWNKNGGWNVATRKTTTTLSMSAGKKSKHIKIYVAPISKYGFIGKWTKLTVKVK